MKSADRPVSPDVVTAAIQYDLDLATAPRAMDYLCGLVRPGSRVVIDMSAVSFLDCAGLSAILAAHRRAALGGGWVRLASLQKGPRRVIEVTRTTKLLADPDEVG
ncbi:MAG TPA: STAS domain-containing protein [Actinomycetales bacterium]|nr:STAS domain-containing protein [Actinomycetales bacterium]